MLRQLRPAIVLFAFMTILTGLIYPFAITGIAAVTFPRQAQGSLIVKNGKVIGSALIGQNFTSVKYFHGRPSATTDSDPNDSTKTIGVPYKADASAASNLGPTSQALIDRVKADATALNADHAGPIPVDLITTSASGLDPDITPAAAEFQIARVAAARGMSPRAVREIVAQTTKERDLGVLGEKRVNVLKLNLALDAAEPSN